MTFNKTTHVIFPSAIHYVDLGSADLLAAKADGTEYVLRVKAALRDFSRESNLSVITEDGAYYTFNVKYADEPVKLSVEIAVSKRQRSTCYPNVSSSSRSTPSRTTRSCSRS